MALSIKLKSILKGSALGTYLRYSKWNKGLLSDSRIEKGIAFYAKDATAEEKAKLKADIIAMARKYRFSVDEYFFYHFPEKSEEERKTFISDLNRVHICEKLNQPKNQGYFDDKLESVKMFGKYYRRDICGVRSNRDLTAFREFLKKQPRFIVKPLTGTCGQGIQILQVQAGKEEQLIQELLDAYCGGAKDGFIAEELVVQTPEMAQFHPSSLNTIRVATVKFPDGPEVIAAFFRTGRGGNIVDNAGAVFFFCTIDVATGVIDAVGDEYGNNYTTHPDTDIPMVGFTIPKWEEAVTMVKELAEVVEGNRYAGWDLALTEKGWVMIEGNARGQFVWQIPRQKGFLAETNEILKRLGVAPLKKLSM